MLINELAKKTGTAIHTLRYYQSLGLFEGTQDPGVKTNNYRDYDEALIDKIALIKEAKEVGFTLSEIRLLLDSWKNSRLTIANKLEIFNEKIKEVETKMQQLNQVRERLLKVLDDINNGDC